MINEVTLLGFLGKDPEVRTFNNGNRAVNFSVATSDQYKDKNTGERRDLTEWHNIVIHNDGIGKIAEQYLKKGSMVWLRGKIETRKWQDQSGADKFTTEIVLRYDGKLKLMPRGSGENNSNGNGNGAGRSRDEGAASRSNERQDSGGYNRDMDDEIPF